MTELEQLVAGRDKVTQKRDLAQIHLQAVLVAAKRDGRDQLTQSEDDTFRLFQDLVWFYEADLAQLDARVEQLRPKLVVP